MGCSISIICLALTIFCLIAFKYGTTLGLLRNVWLLWWYRCRKILNKGSLLYIHLNLAVALFIGLVVFVAGIEAATPVEVWCVYVHVCVCSVCLSVHVCVGHDCPVKVYFQLACKCRPRFMLTLSLSVAVYSGGCPPSLLLPVCILLDVGWGYHAVSTGGTGVWNCSWEVVLPPNTGMGWVKVFSGQFNWVLDPWSCPTKTLRTHCSRCTCTVGGGGGGASAKH